VHIALAMVVFVDPLNPSNGLLRTRVPMLLMVSLLLASTRDVFGR